MAKHPDPQSARQEPRLDLHHAEHEGDLDGVRRTSVLDRLIHERMRLGIVSALAVNAAMSFNELKELLRTTDGNLSVHARKLEEADYIRCTKYFDGRVPKTEYQLTDVGRRALHRYLDHMQALIEATRNH